MQTLGPETEARIEKELCAQILSSTQWVTAFQIAEIVNLNTGNPSKTVNQWKTEGRIFSIQSDGIEYYPLYALDENNGYQPKVIISNILNLFRSTKNDLEIAQWFCFPNSFLFGQHPQDTLRDYPQSTLNAATKAGIAK